MEWYKYRDKEEMIRAKISRAIAIAATMDENTPCGHAQLSDNDYYTVMEVDAQARSEEVVGETHRQYTDIHYVLQGREEVGYAPLSAFEPIQPYDEEQDVLLLRGKPRWRSLYPREYVVFRAGEPHAPGFGEGVIKKIVFKIREF